MIAAYCVAKSYSRAQAEYEALLDDLTVASDGEERLTALRKHLSKKLNCILHGVDLTTTPPDSPLLHLCAPGYASLAADCAQLVVESPFCGMVAAPLLAVAL